MKKKVIAAVLGLLLLAPVTTVKAYDGDLTIPTVKNAVVEGRIKSKIEIDKEKSSVDPWMYLDIKLDATKSKQEKYNYAELALKKAFGFFTDSKLSIKGGDFYIILNDGFIINKDNYKDKNVTEKAMKQIVEKDFYRGDTLFKIAFLYHDNTVERSTYWKLIDTIDLPAGSGHTLTKKYTVGINETEQLDIGQTLGLKLISEIQTSGGFDYKFATAKILGKLSGEVNKTATKAFKNNRQVNSSYESNTTINYKASDNDRVILRYQLVDNYKVDEETFKNATSKLQEAMNQGGVSIVKVAPAAGDKGIDVPMDKIFDVTFNK